MTDKIRHLYIPDTQVKSGVCLNHLNALGHYIVDKQPDVLVMAGDFADMHSLSTYDIGKKASEGARYEHDIAAAKNGMDVLMAPIHEYNEKMRQWKAKQYKPRMVLTLGNHENRIDRHVNSYAVLEGRLSTDDLEYAKHGWEVIPFLTPIEIDGILYSHFFPRSANGRVMQSRRGAPSAAAQVRREFQSCTSGHMQGMDFAIHCTHNKRMFGLIAGSFYMHEEDYLTEQGTTYWRGVIMKNQVEDGEYDPCFISMNYLLDNYWDGVNRYA